MIFFYFKISLEFKMFYFHSRSYSNMYASKLWSEHWTGLRDFHLTGCQRSKPEQRPKSWIKEFVLQQVTEKYRYVDEATKIKQCSRNQYFIQNSSEEW